MYSFHQASMNTLNMGSKISPIDQKNSNTNDVIVFAAPFVMSTTENVNIWILKKDANKKLLI